MKVGETHRNVKLGTYLFNHGGPGIRIEDGNDTAILQKGKLYLSGVSNNVNRDVNIDLNGITFSGSSEGESGISKQNKIIYGFDVVL